jgi:hypothetical protein
LALEVPKTIGELEEVLIRAWDSIPQKTIAHLYTSFEVRLRICLEVKDDSISKYLWFCCDRVALAAWKMNQDSPHVTWTPEEKLNTKCWEPSNSRLVMSSLGKLNVNYCFFQKSITADTLKN